MNPSLEASSPFPTSTPEGQVEPVVEMITLHMGITLTIRPLHPEDTPLLRAFLSRLSPETIYFRFLSQWNELIQEEMMHLSAADDRKQMVLVAITDQSGREEIVAVASYDANPQMPEVAEAAFVVENGYQGKGLGTQLIERLVAYAYGRGICMFQYFVHPNNLPMLRLLRHSGPVIKKKQEYGVCEIWVRLEPKEEHQIWMTQGVHNERDAMQGIASREVQERIKPLVDALRDPMASFEAPAIAQRLLKEREEAE